MNKNAKDLRQKNIELTRDNFTFSSKLIVGNFLQLKEPYANLVSNLNSNNAHQLLNYDATLSYLMDDSVDDKVKKEMKFHILNEEDIVAKICELNPSFKRKTSAFSSINANNNSESIGVNNNGQQQANGRDLSLLKSQKIKKEATLNDLNEQELHNRAKQAQIEMKNKLIQEEHEKQLQMQLQSNLLQMQLQLNANTALQQQQQFNQYKQNHKQHQMQQQQNMRLQQHQEKQQMQQKVKFDMIEAKRKEKYLQRERKTREKWYAHNNYSVLCDLNNFIGFG